VARSTPTVHHSTTRIASCSCKKFIRPPTSRRSLQLEAEPIYETRSSHFELLGLKFRLEKVLRQQSEQEHELKDIRLLMPLILPETERRHLRKLADGDTDGYIGSGVLKTELRHLASLALVERQDDHQISQIKDDEIFRLADYIRLTPLGTEWVKRLSHMDEESSITGS